MLATDVLRDPLWVAAGVVIALLTLLATVWLLRMQSRRRGLAYEESKTSLVSVGEEVGERITVLYDDEPVRGVQVVTVRIFNSGDEPLRESDFDGPIRLDFGAPARILQAEVERTVPGNLEPELYVADSAVSVQPLLLNVRNSVTVAVTLADFPGRLRVTGRAVGVDEVEDVSDKAESPVWPTRLQLVFTGIAVSIIAALILSFVVPDRKHGVLTVAPARPSLGIQVGPADKGPRYVLGNGVCGRLVRERRQRFLLDEYANIVVAKVRAEAKLRRVKRCPTGPVVQPPPPEPQAPAPAPSG